MSTEFSTNSQIQELRSEVETLRSLVRVLLFSLLLATTSLSAYLFRQTSFQGRQIASQKVSMAQMAEEHEKITTALSQLKAFGLRSPDYIPVLAKYGLKPEPLGNTNSTLVSPSKK